MDAIRAEHVKLNLRGTVLKYFWIFFWKVSKCLSCCKSWQRQFHRVAVEVKIIPFFFSPPQIINFYMNLLMERSKEKGLPTVHAFNTFFFTKLKTAGYQAVKRWTKKVDIFSVDLLLVPIHLGVHWCLAVSAFVMEQSVL